MMDVPLVLVVLGLISGISLPKERMVLAGVTIIALPIIGAALGHLPEIGAKLTAVTANLQLGLAGALTTAIAIALYALVMEGLTQASLATPVAWNARTSSKIGASGISGSAVLEQRSRS